MVTCFPCGIQLEYNSNRVNREGYAGLSGTVRVGHTRKGVNRQPFDGSIPPGTSTRPNYAPKVHKILMDCPR